VRPEGANYIGNLRRPAPNRLAAAPIIASLAALNFRVGSMLSKKSFWSNRLNFLKPLMRFVRRDVRDHIVS